MVHILIFGTLIVLVHMHNIPSSHRSRRKYPLTREYSVYGVLAYTVCRWMSFDTHVLELKTRSGMHHP